MKYIIALFLLSAISYQLSAQAQTNLSPTVAIDAPPPAPPEIGFSVTELKFGGQGVGVESCIHVQIINTSSSPKRTVRIREMYIADEKNYSMPSPSKQMFPLSVAPTKNFDISICFKPLGTKTYRTYLVVKTDHDSVALPVIGEGMKPSELKKLPKNDLIILKPTKKQKQEAFQVNLIWPSKLTLQLFDDLGVLKATFATSDYKKEGVYEFPFDGLDLQKKKLPPGNYYLRCVIEEMRSGGTTEKLTKVVKVGKS